MPLSLRDDLTAPGRCPGARAGSGAADAFGDDPGRGVVAVPHGHPLRRQTESCLREVYARHYAAFPPRFPRTLVARTEPGGRIACAAGLRQARDGFFLEAYVDGPIERVLSAHHGAPVARASVVEFTTLASRNPAMAPAFLRRLIGVGRAAGHRWACFTATAELRSLLRAMRVPLLDIAPADPGRVDDPARWGSYYRHDPRVCAVHDEWLDDRLRFAAETADV